MSINVGFNFYRVNHVRGLHNYILKKNQMKILHHKYMHMKYIGKFCVYIKIKTFHVCKN